MTIIYGPCISVHPERQGADRSASMPPHYIVGHTSEQSGYEDPNDAEDLSRFLTSPGDRTTSSGGVYGSSYHAIADTDRVLPAVRDNIVAYAAGGGNKYGLHICLPVKAQTRDQWLDAGSRHYIRQFAEYIVDKSRLYGIPIRRVTDAQMVAGWKGYCDHWTVTRAYKQSTHTDLGVSFPWDILEADIAKIVNVTVPTDPTPGDDDMIALEKNQRAYDSRPYFQADVHPALAWANGTVPKTWFGAGESRRIIVSETDVRQVQINLTVIGHGAAGFVEVSGSPERPTTSLVNFDQADRLESNTGDVLTHEGRAIYVYALAPCDVIIDVRARG